MDGDDTNWSKAVGDLVLGGETDKAISLLESIISSLENRAISFQFDLRKLSNALFELAKLYSTKGLSLKADQIQSRAIRIQQCYEFDLKVKPKLKEFQVLGNEASTCDESTEGRHAAKSLNSLRNELSSGGGSDDDWEAADRAANELYSTRGIPDVSNISLKDTKPWSPKRRGMGQFTYKMQGLYSDLTSGGGSDDDWEAAADRAANELYRGISDVSNISLKDTKPQSPKRQGRGPFTYKKQGSSSDLQSDGPATDELEDEVVTHNSQDTEIRDLKYGTRHVLVLTDFPSRTKTTDIEKLFKAFKDHFVIRWVNHKVALAVFGTPPIAREACNSLRCRFTARGLSDNDELLSSIPPNYLEPPRPRPETTTRVANRLIGNAIGMRLPTSGLRCKELREQEEAQRKRILSSQKMKDDARGGDRSKKF